MKFFAIPALSPEPAAGELTSFLASHRVLAIDRHLVADGGGNYWAVCITYQQSAPDTKANRRARVDYRDVLAEGDFALYARLRELRKNLAQSGAVPPYAIFTNEQLATISTERPMSTTALAGISGVGPARVEKYGEAVLELVRTTKESTP